MRYKGLVDCGGTGGGYTLSLLGLSLMLGHGGALASKLALSLSSANGLWLCDILAEAFSVLGESSIPLSNGLLDALGGTNFFVNNRD